MVKENASNSVLPIIRYNIRNASKIVLSAIKCTFWTVLFLSSAFVNAQQGPCLVGGQLHHADGQTLEISFADAVFPFRKTFSTDSTGRFNLTLLLHDTTEIGLHCNGIPVYFFALPNDSVYLEIDAKSFEPSGAFLQKAIITGRLAGANRSLFDHQAAFNAVAGETTPPKFADPNQSVYQYQEMRLDELMFSLRAWREYLFDFEDTDPMVQRWTDAQLRYQAGVDIMGFPMLPGIRHNLSDTSVYFDIQDIVPLNNSKAHFFSSWHHYLYAYTNLLEYLAQTSPAHRVRKNNLRDRGYPAPMARNQIVLEILMTLPTGEGRNFMLAAFFAGQLTSQGALTNYQVRAFIQTVPYRQRMPIQARMQQGRADWNQRINNWTSNDTLRRELRAVTDAFAGKATQLCFVSDLCPNCLAAQVVPQGYNQLLLGAYCAPSEWKAMPSTSAKFLLSKDAADFWVAYTGIQHFPTCVLVDAEGQM